MATILAPSPPVHSFPCSIGITTISGRSAIWVKSPRTGKVLTFADGWKSRLPDRLWGRIVSAVAAGQHVVTFTRDELAKLAALYPEPRFSTAAIHAAAGSATFAKRSRTR